MTVSHDTLLDAVHGHPTDESTVTDAVVPDPGSVTDVGARLIVQAAPVCVIVTVPPPIVMSPVLVPIAVFAATL